MLPVLNESEWPGWSSRIDLVSFRTFRCPLFHKQKTGTAQFISRVHSIYSDPALFWPLYLGFLMCAESLEDLILFQTFYHLQSNNLCRFEQVLDIVLSCFHLIIILVLKVGQTPFTNIFLIGSNNQFQNYEFGIGYWIRWARHRKTIKASKYIITKNLVWWMLQFLCRLGCKDNQLPKWWVYR